MKQWKCAICGQIFEGEVPPVPCPVCSAGEAAFSLLDSGSATSWRCTVCNQVFDGDTPPTPCPICGAGESAFVKETKIEISFKNDTEDRFVIIGGGVASLEAVKAIRARNKTASIKLVCGEGIIPYNRPALSDVVGDGLSFEAIMLEEYPWYEQNSIELICDARAVKIDTTQKQVDLSNNKSIGYTKLLLATGSNPFIPPVNTDDSVKICSLRNFNDADTLFNEARGKTVAVIGGGILGIEAALALRERGCTINVIELSDRLMPMQADEYASQKLLDALLKINIAVHLGTALDNISGGALTLKNGVSFKADLCLMCIGVRSETTLARECGLDVERGIIVNNFMQTSNPYIFSAGDCAQRGAVVSGLYSAASLAGSVAGANMTGDEIEYIPPSPATAFEGASISLFSAGVFNAPHIQTLVYEDLDNNIYKKMVFKGKKLIGSVLIGDTSEAAKLIAAINSQSSYDFKI